MLSYNVKKENDDLPFGIYKKDIFGVVKKAYFDYAYETIVGRAIAFFGDGLKTVHRRILYIMYQEDITRTYRKCAYIIGAVSGKLHPHGVEAIYQALVKLVQPFSTNIPIIRGQGNFGSIDGDGPAAHRYTEAMLLPYGLEFFREYNKFTAPMIDNYDSTCMEPVFLPSIAPNLFINGSQGIAVGIVSFIPPHNLGEMVDATLYCLNNSKENVHLTDLLNIIKGPDFPTGGIVDSSQFEQIYNTGEGSIRIRSAYIIEEDKITFTEVPYTVRVVDVMQKLNEALENDFIQNVKHVRDESDKHGIKIVCYLKSGVEPTTIIHQIYKSSSLSISFKCCFFALNEKLQPVLYNLKSYLYDFIEFRRKTIKNNLQGELIELQRKMHIQMGYILALENLDEVIKIITTTESKDDALQALQTGNWSCLSLKQSFEAVGLDQNTMQFSLDQSKAILDLRLHQLVRMESDKLIKDLCNSRERLMEVYTTLNSQEKCDQLIINSLELLKKYIKPRKTEVEISQKIVNRELITEESLIVFYEIIEKSEPGDKRPNNAVIKAIPISNFKSQHRGGRGKNLEKAAIQVICNSRDYLYLFTNNKVFVLDAFQIPKERNKPLIQFDITEEIISILAVNEDIIKNQEQYSILFVDENGFVRRNTLDQFIKIRASGKKYMEDGSKLVKVLLCHENQKLMLGTKHGYVALMNVTDFRVCKSRNSKGVIGCRLKEGDRIISAEIVELGDLILSVSTYGYGKLVKVEDFREAKRGSRGVLNLHITKKSGIIAGLLKVSINDEIILSTDENIVRLPVNQINILGRYATGVKLCKFQKDENNKNNMVKYIERIIA